VQNWFAIAGLDASILLKGPRCLYPSFKFVYNMMADFMLIRSAARYVPLALLEFRENWPLIQFKGEILLTIYTVVGKLLIVIF